MFRLLRNRKISTKIFVGFGVVMLMFGAVTLYSVVSAGKIQDTAKYIGDVCFQQNEKITGILFCERQCYIHKKPANLVWSH